MADSVQVFKPGVRALDSSGDPLSGATIEFYDAGTSNARTVYSNNALSTSLGTIVTCDSGGFPTSDGNTKVEVYTGTSDYKIILKDSSGTTIWTLDNIRGATSTSSFLTSSDLEWVTPVTNTSSAQAPGATDGGKFYNVNSSGGDVTFTLADATTNGDDWTTKIRHDGTANQVLLTTSSGTDLFNIPGHAGVTDFALVSQGQVIVITCDGTGYNVEESSPALMATVGVIQITDRLASPPGSPQAGARYIITSGPSGDWSGFSEHDIAESDGAAGWFIFTPATDAGYIAYVIDENAYYHFVGSAWAQSTSSTTVAGTIEQAVQSEMEAETGSLAVTPDVQHFHPRHAKALLNYNQITPAIVADEGVTSVADDGAGIFTVTFDTAFSGTTYIAAGMVYDVAGTSNLLLNGTNVAYTTTTRSFSTATDSGGAQDEGNYIVAFGDQ